MAAIAQHSAATNEHYTPVEIIEASRELMGRIDLDPASCGAANKTVGALHYYDKEHNGLLRPWFWNVFLNPPGGTLQRNADGDWVTEGGRGKRRSAAAVWWSRLVELWSTKRVDQAIFLGFTLEILRSTQHDPCTHPVSMFPMCLPKSRLKFGGNSPTHANVIVYLPPSPVGDSIERFERIFAPIGAGVVPASWGALAKTAC